MESDIVVSMVKDLKEKGMKTASIVADDDSTTFCRLRAEYANISKESDRNHVQKILLCSFCFTKRTQSLTSKVIKF